MADFLEEKRKEIVELGLTFKLMTQYTSFVAIDDAIYTGGDEPRRVDVPTSYLASSSTVAITQNCTLLEAAVGCVQSRAVHDLPLQGRSILGLLTLTPGTSVQTNISMRGQSTNFVVDGVNMNFGVVPGGESPGTLSMRRWLSSPVAKSPGAFTSVS